MLKRDFIMVQIEELGKALARLVFNRKSGKDLDKNPDLIEQAFGFGFFAGPFAGRNRTGLEPRRRLRVTTPGIGGQTPDRRQLCIQPSFSFIK